MIQSDDAMQPFSNGKRELKQKNEFIHAEKSGKILS